MSPTFTTLPWELRNEIYSYVFYYKNVSIRTFRRHAPKLWLLNPLPKRTDNFYGISAPQETLALLRINHQIYEEAAAYFYHKMLFRGTWPALRSFIKGIGAYRRDMIKSVEITQTDPIISVFKHNEAFRLLSGLPSLRKLRVAIPGIEFFKLVTSPEKPPSPQGLSNFTTSVEIRVFVPEHNRELIAQNGRRNGKFGLVLRAQLYGQENWFQPMSYSCDAKVFRGHMVTDKTADHVTRRVVPRVFELHFPYEIPTLRPPWCELPSD